MVPAQRAHWQVLIFALVPSLDLRKWHNASNIATYLILAARISALV